MGVIIYDWLSVSSKIDSPQSMINLLGLEHLNFMETHGFYGYKTRLYYDGISIHYAGRDDMGILLEMSGTGCRTFETFSSHKSWEKIFDVFCHDDSYHITRLDVAYDDICNSDDSYILDMGIIVSDVRNKNYVSRFKSWEIVETDSGVSVGIGSKKSDVYIRIYDKSAERGGLDYHWVRLEIQMRRERCKNFLLLDVPIGERFCGVLLNYVRFLKPNFSDVNKSRWEIADWYKNFIGNAEKISIYTKRKIDYDLYQLEHYVTKQAGNSIYTYLSCVGMEKFMEKINNRKTKLSKKQEFLLSDFKNTLFLDLEAKKL